MAVLSQERQPGHGASTLNSDLVATLRLERRRADAVDHRRCGDRKATGGGERKEWLESSAVSS
jgi:hypothetical protein